MNLFQFILLLHHQDYYIDQLADIMGILVSMVESNPSLATIA